MFFTGPPQYTPTATLATIVFIIGIELIDVPGMSEIGRQRSVEFWVAWIAACKGGVPRGFR